MQGKQKKLREIENCNIRKIKVQEKQQNMNKTQKTTLELEQEKTDKLIILGKIDILRTSK